MDAIELTRVHNGTDAYLGEYARTAHELFVSDLARFTDFDSTANAAYGNAFLASIVAVETLVHDTAVIDQVAHTTELTVAMMNKAREKYMDMKYFIKKAFADSIAIQNEFGLNDYENARRNSAQMILFLEQLYKSSVHYQTLLIASGCSTEAIEQIANIGNALLTANSNQNISSKRRPKLTEDRIKTLNACYAYVVNINALAQLVYKTDYAKQQQFIYNPASETQSREYAGMIAPNAIKEAAQLEFSLDNVFSFKNTGVVPLSFCLSKTAVLEGEIILIGGGATIIKKAIELNDGGIYLLVKNNDANIEGSYIVEVNY